MSDDDYIVTPKNAHLLCEFHNTYWCLHVEQVVKEGSDAEHIWEEYPNDQEIEVPIVPTSNLWGRVTLISQIDSPSARYKAYYHKEVTSEGEFLGFIHPSEGRFVLRSMLISWFEGTQMTDRIVCQSVGHGYKQSMRWERDKKKYPGEWLAQRWAVWATGKCLGCTFTVAPDLIPDEEKKTVWS